MNAECAQDSRGVGCSVPGVELREVDSRDDLFEIARVWHHWFGARYGPDRLPRELAHIVGWVDEDDAPIDVYAVIAEHETVSVGWGIAVHATRQETLEDLPEGSFDAEELVPGSAGWMQFSAVDRAWRSQGIGRALFENRLRWLADQDPSIVLGLSWERDGRTSRPLFEGCGFHPIEYFPDYYANVDWDRSPCPECGITVSDDEVCECGATLWALDGSDIDA
ncbi:GNAT family N-acetyltransferase [Halorhabdus rudnickae]|uniref:GNAT family N-acetyltransferase n=1 Tax=Halorhabdus rudnickae TaxID=1775544 RepID=UPI001082B9F0